MKLFDKEALQFDDVLLEPQFSNIKSRKDVDVSSTIGGVHFKLPIISSPMDSITTVDMATALHQAGGLGALHRFQSIQDNVTQFKAVPDAIVSVGLNDWERVDALYSAGATKFLLDVAHGAQISVVEFVNEFRAKYKGNLWLMVGNFATENQIADVGVRLQQRNSIDAYRVGIGGGAACTTRVKTGHGLPTLESIISCVKSGANIVADGGIRNPGDVAKVLAAGAKAVMVGRMLAGTDETPNFEYFQWPSRDPIGAAVVKTENKDGYTYYTLSNGKCWAVTQYDNHILSNIKIYRGSASAESYNIQGKDWACAEGEAYVVPAGGPVIEVLNELEAGLRSAMTYTGATTLQEFHQKAVFVKVTSNGASENQAHGKKL